MAKLTTAEFIDAIKELSVLELNELVKACEEEFGVSAAAGVVVAETASLFCKPSFCYYIDFSLFLPLHNTRKYFCHSIKLKLI